MVNKNTYIKMHVVRWVPVSRIHRASFLIACMDSENGFYVEYYSTQTLG